MKKGQGLPLNVIIIAAIVLIVLVVLWAIFTGRMGKFSTGLVKAEKCEPACKAIGYSGTPSDETKTNCVGEAKYFLGTDYVKQDGTKYTKGCCCTA